MDIRIYTYICVCTCAHVQATGESLQQIKVKGYKKISQYLDLETKSWLKLVSTMSMDLFGD